MSGLEYDAEATTTYFLNLLKVLGIPGSLINVGHLQGAGVLLRWFFGTRLLARDVWNCPLKLGWRTVIGFSSRFFRHFERICVIAVLWEVLFSCQTFAPSVLLIELFSLHFLILIHAAFCFFSLLGQCRCLSYLLLLMLLNALLLNDFNCARVQGSQEILDALN